MPIPSKGRHLCRREVFGEDLRALRLYRGIGIEQAGHVHHRDAEDLADEVARVVDGGVMGWGAMAIQHENPLETILRNLTADVCDERSKSGLSNAVRARVDSDIADLIGP